MKQKTDKGHQLTIDILGKLLDGIIVIDIQGKILFANISAANLFCKSTEALVGQDFGYVIVPQVIQEIQIIQDQRIIFVQMLSSNIIWNEQAASLISLRDVTTLKKGEVDLQLERQKLEQSNLELSQYASMASHDLKEPVRKIRLYTQRLIDKYAGEIASEPFKLIDKISKSATRLSSIIESVARFTNIKVTSLNITPVDINQVIEQVIDDLEILIIDRRVSINVGEIPMVNGDAGMLYQLFLNLLCNSIKYSPESRDPDISIKGTLAGGIVQIEFEDNGSGFDNKYADKIFEPFQRLDSNLRDGSGMGLAICKRIVDAHNGFISADSKPEIGTKFRIQLPQVHKVA